MQSIFQGGVPKLIGPLKKKPPKTGTVDWNEFLGGSYILSKLLIPATLDESTLSNVVQC